ncbi:hypothetical protein BGY98DRAFT_932802 [Russula aff. rugulosa BPL654]|nr:hypothetical protein BGY98DRAFT_932802 [Russula aff. rugulosa BPL654]
MCANAPLYLLNLGTSDPLMSSPTPADHGFALQNRESGLGCGQWSRAGRSSLTYHNGGRFQALRLRWFSGGKTTNDMWALDLNRLKSQPLWESYEPTPGNEKPLPRWYHVSVTTEDRIIIFGGFSDGHYYNDTWSFDISTRKWTELQCTGSIPSPRDVTLLSSSMMLFVDAAMVQISQPGDKSMIFIESREDEVSLIHVFDTTFKLRTQRTSMPGNARRKLSVSLAVQNERKHRIAQLTEELALKSDLLEQAEANVRRDAELVDMQARLDELVVSRDQQVGQYEKELGNVRIKLEANESELEAVRLRLADAEKASRDQEVEQYEKELTNVRAKLEAKESELEAVRLRLADADTSLDELEVSRNQQVGQYESVRAKLEANESELEAIRLRLTDAEKGLAKSKAEADTLRAQNATGSVNRDEDQVTRRLMERCKLSKPKWRQSGGTRKA